MSRYNESFVKFFKTSFILLHIVNVCVFDVASCHICKKKVKLELSHNINNEREVRIETFAIKVRTKKRTHIHTHIFKNQNHLSTQKSPRQTYRHIYTHANTLETTI